ncbi:hypothetical protein [Nonomuraea africana]|uniref:Uncharacterized protein n=1 Tax=Nonomuraea africana TaxID=46171 RepID=A0ABR9KAZ1_9ACTN|nr:hypothetical protein [Nonomuraea africana]MBE1559005.1 hypothetical protein [Nonomuraea africana]
MTTAQDGQAPAWNSWAPRAVLAWTLLYGTLQAYWAFVDSPPQMSPVGVDLIAFSGWKAVALCLAAAAVTLGLGRLRQSIVARRVLLAGAWTVSGAWTWSADCCPASAL